MNQPVVELGIGTNGTGQPGPPTHHLQAGSLELLASGSEMRFVARSRGDAVHASRKTLGSREA